MPLEEEDYHVNDLESNNNMHNIHNINNNNTINNPINNNVNELTNSEFMYLILFFTSRFLIYGALLFVLYIFILGKHTDPAGFGRLTKAFMLLEQDQSGVKLESIITSEEYFDKNDPVYYEIQNIKETDISYPSESSINWNVQVSRKELVALTEECVRLEGQLEINLDTSQCNKEKYSFHEIILEPDLELEFRNLHGVLMELVREFNEKFKFNHLKSFKFDENNLDCNEMAIFTDKSLELIENFKSLIEERLE